MSLSEKIAAEAAAERERIGYDPRQFDRYGNAMVSAPDASIANDEILPGITASEALTMGTFETDCEHGCIVEPDGTCPHGVPSPLLAAGLI